MEIITVLGLRRPALVRGTAAIKPTVSTAPVTLLPALQTVARWKDAVLMAWPLREEIL